MNINNFINAALVKKQRYVLEGHDDQPFFIKKFTMSDREAMMEFVAKHKIKDKKLPKEKVDSTNTLIAIYAQLIYGVINEDNSQVFTEKDYVDGKMSEIPENWIMGMLYAITQYNTIDDKEIIKK